MADAVLITRLWLDVSGESTLVIEMMFLNPCVTESCIQVSTLGLALSRHEGYYFTSSMLQLCSKALGVISNPSFPAAATISFAIITRRAAPTSPDWSLAASTVASRE